MIDVTSPINQQFIDQVKRDRSISKDFNEWLELMVSHEVIYIGFLVEMKMKEETMMDDLEEKLNAWDEGKERWEDVVAHIREV